MAQRSTSRSTDAPDLIVGLVRGAHGVRGEVRIDPRTDVSDRFHRGRTLLCDGIGALEIASLRGTPDAPIVGFAGYASREQADALRGRFLRVPAQEARRAAGGAYLWADLVGLEVRSPSGEALGVVADIIRTGSADVLVVRRDGGELLLPALESVIREVDLDSGSIVAVPQERY
ncbi:MAG: ribosome maturation factor RimM [Chloroflexota bacterium]|nr:ribosome maturation factor RimM [Chloroflexota bacterium]